MLYNQQYFDHIHILVLETAYIRFGVYNGSEI